MFVCERVTELHWKSFGNNVLAAPVVWSEGFGRVIYFIHISLVILYLKLVSKKKKKSSMTWKFHYHSGKGTCVFNSVSIFSKVSTHLMTKPGFIRVKIKWICTLYAFGWFLSLSRLSLWIKRQHKEYLIAAGSK